LAGRFKVRDGNACKGYADVVIVDLAENGKAYAPAEFREFFWIQENNTARYEARPSRPIIAVAGAVNLIEPKRNGCGGAISDLQV
jgi:hypothetical protein